MSIRFPPAAFSRSEHGGPHPFSPSHASLSMCFAQDWNVMRGIIVDQV